MKKLLLIYNPKAGKAKLHGSLADVIEIFDNAGYQVTVRPTHGPKDTTRFITDYAKDYDRIVISGGDGTLNEGLCGILEAKKTGIEPCPLGYLPTGSTNDFATSLGLPTDPAEAAECAVSGEVFSCDAGFFNGHPFAYVAAFGAFTEVPYATPQKNKNTLGHLAYVLEGIKTLPQIKGIPLTVTTEDRSFSGRYLFGMVSNSNSIGGVNGFFASQQVQFDDGWMELLLIEEPNSLTEQSELLADLLSMNLDSKYLTVLKTRRIVFTAEEPLAWTLDGEFGGTPTEAEICAVTDAYKIVIPKKD